MKYDKNYTYILYEKNSVARANEDNQLIIEKFTENFNHLNVKAGKL